MHASEECHVCHDAMAMTMARRCWRDGVLNSLKRIEERRGFVRHATESFSCCLHHFLNQWTTLNGFGPRTTRSAGGLQLTSDWSCRTEDTSSSWHVPRHGCRMRKSYQQQSTSRAAGLWHGLAGERGTVSSKCDRCSRFRCLFQGPTPVCQCACVNVVCACDSYSRMRL